MGWYLKKSFSFGPLQLNLSKSGLGASIGVKGLRISTGPKGAQVNAGREGLYYRKSLSPRLERPSGANAATEQETFTPEQVTSGPSEASAAKEMVESPASTVASSVGRQLGNQLIRGILGGLFRGR